MQLNVNSGSSWTKNVQPIKPYNRVNNPPISAVLSLEDWEKWKEAEKHLSYEGHEALEQAEIREKALKSCPKSQEAEFKGAASWESEGWLSLNQRMTMQKHSIVSEPQISKEIRKSHLFVFVCLF